MHESKDNTIDHRCTRRGLSMVETLACLVALIGGVTLGSIYLGVDFQRLVLSSYGAEETSDVEQQDDQPDRDADAPMQDSETHTSSTTRANKTSDQAPAHEESAAPTTDSNAAAPQAPPVAQVETSKTPSQASPQPRSPLSGWVASLNEENMLTDEQRAALTRAYWLALISCLDSESANRHAVLKNAENLQLFDYLAHRQIQHRLTADKIGELSPLGVDSHIAAFGAKALAWQEAGATLFSRASALLTDAPTAQLTGPFAQSWQSAATQHRMEERLLLEKRKAVESYVRHVQDDGELATQ